MHPATWFDDDVVDDAPVGDDHVAVRLGGGRYALRARDVAEVIAVPRVSRVPGAPVWVSGVANWRGHVLPVIDLRPVLRVAAVPLPSSARVVVLTADDLEVGVVAEAVMGMVEVPPGLGPAPASLAGDAAELVAGLADGGPAGPLAVLRTDAVLGLRSRLPAARG